MGCPFISKPEKNPTDMVENKFNVSKASTLACLFQIYSLEYVLHDA